MARYEYAPNNGNLIKTTYANGNTVELVYDVFDRVVEEKYNGTVKYRYVYNGEGDLAKKIEVQRSGLSEKEVNIVNYEYDSLDRLIHSSEERIEDGKTTEVQRSEHIYDGENRITKQSWSVGGEAGRSENYTYSTTDGTLQSMKTANGETISFGYDALKRLKRIASKRSNNTDFITQTYTYHDRAGQTDGKQLTTNQIANIAYTGIANPFDLSYEYDAIGNVSKVSQGSTEIAEYQYDKLNQLISEKLPQQHLEYTYTYDTSGNIREVKTTNTQTKKTTTDTYAYEDSDWKDHLFAYCDNNPVNRADTEGEIWNVIAGAVLGASFNVATQMLANFISGDRLSSGLVSAAISGAIGGAVTALPGMGTVGEIVVNGVTSGIVEATSQVRANKEKKKRGQKESSRTEIACSVATAAISSAASSLVPPRTRGSAKNVVKSVKHVGRSCKSAVKAVRTLCVRGKKQGAKRVATGIKTCTKAIRKSAKRNRSVWGATAKGNFMSVGKTIYCNISVWAMSRYKKWLKKHHRKA